MVTSVVQLLIFLVGVVVLFTSGADGSWESMNFAAYFGMSLCLLALVLHLVIGFIEKLMSKWK